MVRRVLAAAAGIELAIRELLHQVKSPLGSTRRLAALVRASDSDHTGYDCSTAMNLGGRMPGLGRQQAMGKSSRSMFFRAGRPDLPPPSRRTKRRPRSRQMQGPINWAFDASRRRVATRTTS